MTNYAEGAGVSKQKRSDPREVMIEAACVVVRTCPYWEAGFARLREHTGNNKTIAVIARKLPVVIWHVLRA
jgi:hypothetical protein